jgi:hypothetical protein
LAARRDRAGLGLLRLRRYSPDLLPLDPVWSSAKIRLRVKPARITQALYVVIGPALDTIIERGAKAWFRRCGYPPIRPEIAAGPVIPPPSRG